MARQPSDLFTHRSATREFLFSRSDDLTDGDAAQNAPGDRHGADDGRLRRRFPDMLDRQALVKAIDAHMASAPTLCAIAVDIEPEMEMIPDDGQPPTLPEVDIAPITALCQDHDGIWAQLCGNRFACAFEIRSAADGHGLANRLLSAYAETSGLTVTIGIAAYPTLDYGRRQVVENAEKALTHAGFFGPGNITAFDAVSLNISGDHCYQTGNITGAVEEFKKGLRLDPADANLHNSLGVCYGVLQDYENALKAFEHAIRLEPRDVMAVYNRGYIHLLMGNRQAALEDFLEADAIEPNVFEVAFHIGQTLMEMGAIEKARTYLETATTLNCRSGPAFKSLGACLDKLGLTKEAIQAYKRTVKINPGDAESLSNLGRLYNQRGESLDVATVLCEQSVKLSPDNGLFRHHLGMVYLNRGKLDLALTEFEMAASLGHDSRPQIDAIQDQMLTANAS
jgi:tetratricopeptide (TPR) repeat protein